MFLSSIEKIQICRQLIIDVVTLMLSEKVVNISTEVNTQLCWRLYKISRIELIFI